MSIRSGKFAYVNGIPCVSSWQVSQNVQAARYAASCVGDGTGTPEGNEDWSGSIEGVGYLPPWPSDTDLTFEGVVSAAAGDLLSYGGNILVEEATINFPKAAGGEINWSASFGVQGALAKSTASGSVDATRQEAPSAKLSKIVIDPLGSDYEVEALQVATLVIRRPHSTYVDNGLTYRRAGNLELDLSFDVLSDDLEIADLAENTEKLVRLFVNATEYFEIQTIRFLGKSNFVVNRRSNDIVGFSQATQWNAVDGTTEGHILLPDGSTYLYGSA